MHTILYFSHIILTCFRLEINTLIQITVQYCRGDFLKKFSTKYRLRELREDHDLSQTKLAKLLDMSQTGYSKYETGENDIPTNILIRLSQIYETSIDYLLNQTDEKKPYKRKE